MRAPELQGNIWFNSKPLTPAELLGKVVLYDFWTYSCVNCQRTLPHLQEWWKKYKDKNFLIIGIHTPEFEFEKEPKNVERAMKDLGVTWPVVLDDEYLNWNNFANRYWPAKYLADKNGKIVYTHFGEGAYSETESAIQELITQTMGAVKLPEVQEGERAHGNVCFVATPETYCGYERGNIKNEGGYEYDKEADYTMPEELPENGLALKGKFIARPQFVESREKDAEINLRFRATEVNLVLHPVESASKVEVLLDGKPLKTDLRGKDVSKTGLVEIKKPTLYNLIKSRELVEGVLTVRVKQGSFQAYAFTFSGCANFSG